MKVNTNIWSQLPGENKEQYSAFKRYVKLGCNMLELEKKWKKGHTRRTLNRWKEKFKWEQRARLVKESTKDDKKEPDFKGIKHDIEEKVEQIEVVYRTENTNKRKADTIQIDQEFDISNPILSIFRTEIELYIRYKKACASVLKTIEDGRIDTIQHSEVALLKLLQDQGKNLTKMLDMHPISVDNGVIDDEAKLDLLTDEELEVLREIHRKIA